MKLLDDLKPYENTEWLNETISKIRKRGGVIIYGAARYGIISADILIKNAVTVFCFCDDDEKKLNRQIKGLDTINLDEAAIRFGTDTQIFICSYSGEPVINKMKANCAKTGFTNVHHIMQFTAFYETIASLSKIEDKLEAAYNLLEDEKSKELFKRLLAVRLSGDISRLVDLAEDGQYFDPDLVKLTETEVFVDCGAYDGDTVAEFIRRTKGKYHRVYGFEADARTADLLKNNTRGLENVFTFSQGCYNKNGTVTFSSGLDQTSNINENGEETIKVCRLDDFMKDKARPTFIKMDIEGAELAALQGAEFVIRNYKPRLAICLYHKPDDIWEIPLYIKSLCPEYLFYMRAYSPLPIEYVLYAVL
ncbi:MAG: FkbM family methyltransferase [Syntrophomonadaceae bacterium]|jgi:FkbM family methyltransferase|nr:FkbM family methyltransferase [Syntrophomonadaceae bacterium]